MLGVVCILLLVRSIRVLSPGTPSHGQAYTALYLVEVAIAEPGDGLRLPVRQRRVEGDHVGGSLIMTIKS